ncbi:MAG: response regulator [Nitrospirota bacterium]
MPQKILIVDDEEDLLTLLEYNLSREGFSVEKAKDGYRCMEIVRERPPDLLILDLMLPELSGLEVCRLIRKEPRISHTPIIMLTARSQEMDRVIGLEIGADDYITKPFSIRELIARVRAVLRRKGVAEEKKITAIDMEIDPTRHRVTIKDKVVELSPIEFNILKFLAENRGRVFSRNQILDNVWKNEGFVEPRTVDVHIRRLRTKIEEDAERPKYIKTVRGLGYRFIEEEQ